jgi:hypothetical protein
LKKIASLHFTHQNEDTNKFVSHWQRKGGIELFIGSYIQCGEIFGEKKLEEKKRFISFLLIACNLQSYPFVFTNFKSANRDF